VASTQTQRTQFKDPFFVGVHTSGSKRGRPICNFALARRVVFYAGGSAYPSGRVTLKVHPLLVDTFIGIASVFYAHRYAFEETAGGTLSCRNITGASAKRIEAQILCQCPRATTLHLHGLALDINPSRNRYRRVVGVVQWGRHTDLPKALIADIEAIKTKRGKRAVEWGGRWWNIKDPMHFENDLTRTELEVGIDRSTIKGLAAYLAFAGGAPPPINPEEEQMLKRGDKGNAVGRIQTALMAWNPAALPRFGADKDFGGETETWVGNYQASADLEPTGIVDGLTGAFLLEYLADHAAGGGTVDAYTKTQADVKFATRDHPHTAVTKVN
jgi:hypothetical protein